MCVFNAKVVNIMSAAAAVSPRFATEEDVVTACTFLLFLQSFVKDNNRLCTVFIGKFCNCLGSNFSLLTALSLSLKQSLF